MTITKNTSMDNAARFRHRASDRNWTSPPLEGRASGMKRVIKHCSQARSVRQKAEA